MNAQPSELEVVRALAVELAKRAGDQLISTHHLRLEVQTKSSASDWVSDADRAAERIIVEELARTRPNDGILGEEGSLQESANGWTWVIDPLDGTSNYLRGYPGWAVSIAVERHGNTVVGIVHDPTARRTYEAVSGEGAQRNGQPITTSACGDLSSAIIGTGFSYHSPQRARQGERLASLLPLVADIRRCGSAALELCHVADGSLDGFFEDDLEKWDWAAGALIVEEGGGRVIPIHDDATSGVVAAPCQLLPAMSKALGY